jgi:hypothetical protein
VTYQNGDGSKQMREQHDLHATLEAKRVKTHVQCSPRIRFVVVRSRGCNWSAEDQILGGGKEETDMIRMAVRGSGWGAPRGRSVPGARGEVCMVVGRRSSVE